MTRAHQGEPERRSVSGRNSLWSDRHKSYRKKAGQANSRDTPICNAAKTRSCGGKEAHGGIIKFPLNAGSQKARFGENQRRSLSICPAKTTAAARGNRTTGTEPRKTEETQLQYGIVKEEHRLR